MTRSRVATIVGILVGVIGMAFVVRLFVAQREQTGEILDQIQPGWLVLAFVLGLAGMTIIGSAWNLLLGALQTTIPWRVAYRGYFVGQLGKYVPGGVWAVVGRGEWARRSGIAAGVAYSSTALSVLTAYLAAASLAVVTVPLAAPSVGLHPLSLLVIAVAVVGVPLLHPAVMGRALDVLKRLLQRSTDLRLPAYAATLRVIGVQIVTWLLIGTGTWCVSRGLGSDLPWVVAVAATCVSWVVGLLVLPVPGGIGIREGVFVAVLGGIPEAAAIALASRLVAVSVDAVGAAVATVIAIPPVPSIEELT